MSVYILKIYGGFLGDIEADRFILNMLFLFLYSGFLVCK